MTGQKLKASIGIGGRSTNATGREKADASDTASLANARVPKYTARILFLKVIAYTLSRGRISWSGDRISTAYLNVMKMSEENKENMVKTISAWYAAIHLGVWVMSTKNCHLSRPFKHRLDLSPSLRTNSVGKRLKAVCCGLGVSSLGLTLEFLGPLRM